MADDPLTDVFTDLTARIQAVEMALVSLARASRRTDDVARDLERTALKS